MAFIHCNWRGTYTCTNYVIEGKGVYGKQDGTPHKKKLDGESRPTEENYIDNRWKHTSL
jgi:hypothetical protein